MFNKKNKIVIFIHENIMLYPPTITLVECLLNNGYKVHLVGEGTNQLPSRINNNQSFSCFEVGDVYVNGIISKIKRRRKQTKDFRKELAKVGANDIVWTVNPIAVRMLRKDLMKYSSRHIMQMLELKDKYPMFRTIKCIKFKLDKYARAAWKVVVAEENRAYIQKVGWNLKRLPYVLPNKPYSLNPGGVTDDMQPVISQMEKEDKKIIIYLGVLDPDRDFVSFVKAIDRIKDEYVFYVFGKLADENKTKVENLFNKYSSVKYMGFFNPPKHLFFLRYAYIALLPYKPGLTNKMGFSILNALYCAPNKIFEYAGNKLPMIGTDVLGLKGPFEKYNMGVCCKDLEPETIIEAINYVDKNHDEMQKNCLDFCDSVNVDSIVERIINE